MQQPLELSEDEKAVKETVNLFFDSLTKQDTVLMKKAVLTDGQVWTRNNIASPPRVASRFLSSDLNSFDPEQQLLETPLSFEIKVHNGLAMAWVPYEFRLNKEFSHCGVDIFTLIKKENEWKITTISYTIDRNGCDELGKGSDE